MALPGNSPNGDFNCAWSPDGTKIAYVQGTFTMGDLVMENSDLSGGLQTLEATFSRFDGNPDWAPDGRPICQDTTVSTGINTPVTIPLSCADTGPAYERTGVSVDVPSDGLPANGTVGAVQQGSPATVTYTPNAGFSGSDSFQVRPRDGVAFGTQRATVIVNVQAPTAGNPAPTVSGLRVKRRFRKTRALPKLTKRRRGYTISFSLSEDARVTLSFERKLRGRRVRGRCVKPTRRNRSARRCTRYKRVRTRIRLNAKQGFNKVVFKGRLSRRRSLKPGRYRLTVVGRDSEGAKSKRKRASFRLLRAKRRRR
jgi:hypothetical protein